MANLNSKKWVSSAFAHAKDRPLSSLGIILPLLITLILFTQSVYQLAKGQSQAAIGLALLAGMGGFLATSVGALPVLALRSIPGKVEDVMLGFAAGMMLAASAFSLIIPGIEVGQEMLGHRFGGVLLVAAGLMLGTLLMMGLEEYTPHAHEHAGGFGVGSKDIRKIWLFVFAIALHNLPEGMAMGVGFSRADWSIGLPISSAIAIQDIPEGLAVALSLRSAQVRPVLAFLIACMTGLLEPLGAILGATLVSGTQYAYPVGLGLAAGAMIFVVSHEVIPETHRNGHQTPSTIGLMLGFILMMILDTALGS
jgi:zinc transporter, ZIP family